MTSLALPSVPRLTMTAPNGPPPCSMFSMLALTAMLIYSCLWQELLPVDGFFIAVLFYCLATSKLALIIKRHKSNNKKNNSFVILFFFITFAHKYEQTQ
jgi:hypothetical protein